MKDNFSTQSTKYAKFRPTYPSALYHFLLDQVSEKNSAWDCATGNGQVASELSKYFTTVYATDISKKQIDEAPKIENITYKVEQAEHTAFGNHQFDLITVAQAIHWFKFDDFFLEIQRVLKPKGIFAAFGYGLMTINPHIDKIIHRLYEEILGPYWDEERKHIENGYLDIEFPFEEIESPSLEITSHWNFEQLVGYLETWSSLQHYIKAHKKNPVELISKNLKQAWRENETKAIHFPLILKVFRF